MAGESIIWIVFSAPKYDRCFVITGSPLAGSAINATLFSSGHFAEGLLSDDLLPVRPGTRTVTASPNRRFCCSVASLRHSRGTEASGPSPRSIVRSYRRQSDQCTPD